MVSGLRKETAEQKLNMVKRLRYNEIVGTVYLSYQAKTILELKVEFW